MSKAFLSAFVNILIGILLLGFFFIADQKIVQTFAVAKISALKNLKPCPIEYLWKFNFHQAPLDKNKIREYADYYEHLLRVFPELREAYGVLGYCYHYLNDDPKAVKFFKMAIGNYPDLFWNYYNLAVIYINESRYQEASDVLQRALKVDAVASLREMFSSQMVYLPLLEEDENMVVNEEGMRLKEGYETSFFLMKILNEAAYRKEISAIMRKFHPELYAF